MITFGVGSATTLARVEDDLEQRVGIALDEQGVDAATVSFSGQDGTVTCAI